METRAEAYESIANLVLITLSNHSLATRQGKLEIYNKVIVRHSFSPRSMIPLSEMLMICSAGRP